MLDRLKRFGKIAIAAVITAVALWLSFRSVDWTLLKASLSRLSFFWIILATANSLFTVYALGWRWRILLEPKERIGLGRLFRLNIISQYANILLPARMGEIVRARMTAIESRASTAFVLGTIAIERVLDVTAFIALWILVPVFFVIREQRRSYSLVVFFCLLAAGVMAVSVARPQLLFRGIRFAARALPGSLRERFLRFGADGLEAFAVLRRPRIFASLAPLTFVFILGQVLTNFFVLQGCHLRLPLYAALFILLGVQVGYAIPSVPGKIGIFEYSVILSLAAFRLPKGDALGYGLVLHAVAFLPKIALGFLFLCTSRLSLRKSQSVPETSGD